MTVYGGWELDIIRAASAELSREIDREIIRKMHPDPPGWSAVRRGSGWNIDNGARQPRSLIGTR